MPRPLDVKTVFKRAFGYTPPRVVKVPGFVELLGNGDEFNRSLLLSLAVDHYGWLAASPRNDGRVEIVSSACPEKPVKFWISEFNPDPETPWADPVKGVLTLLRKRGVHFGGFTAAFHPAFPPGLDFGLNAILAVATALLVRALFPYRLTETRSARPPQRDRAGELPPLTPKERLYTARLCHEALAGFAQLDSTLVGPLTALLGREYHTVQVDLLHATTEVIPLVGEFCIILCDAGPSDVPRGDVTDLRATCEAAAEKLHARSLRSIEPRYLSLHKARLSEREHACAYHVAGENVRVAFADRALREDDLSQLGFYLYQSHESAREFYRTTAPDQDLLVELAREQPVCLGARATGGHWGTTTVNLVSWSHTDAFMKTMRERFQEKTGRALNVVLCKVVDGADMPRRRTVLF
jgi:galactokinase